MKTLSSEEFRKQYGLSAVSTFAQQPQAQKPQSAFGRVSDVISNAGSQVNQAIQGTGEYVGQNPLQRGIEATASAFNAVPKATLAASPEPVRKASEFVGEKVGQGFQALTQLIGSNPQLQKWVQENPEATQQIMDISKTAVAGGQIAGTILGAKKTADTLQVGTDLAKAGAVKVAQTSKEAFGELRPTPEKIALERAAKIRSGFEEQNTRLKSADKSFNENTITRKLPDGTTKKITPIDTFAENDIVPDIQKGSIQMGDYKTGTGPLGKIREQVKLIDNEIDTKLVNTGQTIKIVDLEKAAMQAVKSNAELRQAGTVVSTMAKMKSRFDDYRLSYGDSIDIAELNNIRKVANKDWNLDTLDTSRVIGDVARNQVYDAIPDNEIRLLLQKQGELLSARKYAEKINGSKVSGGKLGNYALRGTGAIVGATIEKAPVVGPIAGMLGGEAAARVLQQSQFKNYWTEIRALMAKDSVK